MTTNLRPRSTNWDGIQISDFAQPNDLTANRACIDQLKCPYVPSDGTGTGSGLPEGTNYSDYLFWQPPTGPFAEGQWVVGDTEVHLGANAGLTLQGDDAVAIGSDAGNNNQGEKAVAIGNSAGNNNQGDDAVAIGNGAGNNNQGEKAVAIGIDAGNATQGASAVAIGDDAGNTLQGSGAVAIGQFAGQTNQGDNSIAIGASASLVGGNFGNTIVLNSSGTNVNPTVANQWVVATSALPGGLPTTAAGAVAVNAPAAIGTFDHYLVYDSAAGEIRACPF
jgi:hypothetical protein